MDLFLQPKAFINKQRICISGSKSETNRWLLLQALFPEVIIENTSNADDADVMQKALANFSQNAVIDVHHAGTAMRFLTAFFAQYEGLNITLTGSKRMKQRPIQILVDALRTLGASITYLENEGFPPLKIEGKKLQANHPIQIQAGISSQYITALLLIGPKLSTGLTLELTGKVTSAPYLQMTLQMLISLGVAVEVKGTTIQIQPFAAPQNPLTATVESDWSSASYFFSLIALGNIGDQVVLEKFRRQSWQADAVLPNIYKHFGVETHWDGFSLVIEKKEQVSNNELSFDLTHAPDIAQTIAVTAFGLGISSLFTGLHTLKIKETDRILALQNELTKLGAKVNVTDDSLHLLARTEAIQPHVSIQTYQDHRMAMSFAPLARLVPISICESEVVSKSYPDFWRDFERLGLK